MKQSSNWYTRWPEWLRWIICFPASFLFSHLFGIAIAATLDSAGLHEQLAWLVQPALSISAFVFLMYSLTPRWKYRVTLTLLIVHVGVVAWLNVVLMIAGVNSFWDSAIPFVTYCATGFACLWWVHKRATRAAAHTSHRVD